MSEAAPRPKYKRTVAEYAALYSCTDSSIKRYRAKGYPLDEPAKMAEIFAAQKSRPAGVQNLVAIGSLESDAYEDSREEGEASADTVASIDSTGGASDIFTVAAKINAAKLEKVLLECQRLAFRNEVERGLWTKNSELQPKLHTLLAETKAALRKALENELPPKCEGLNAADIQLKMREALDGVLGDLTRGTERLADMEPHALADELPPSSTTDNAGNPPIVETLR